MDTHMIKKQLTSVYRYAYTNLTLNYYTYFEMLEDLTGDADKLTLYTDRFNSLLGEFLENKTNIGELDQLRNQIIEVMYVLTSCADGLMIYEYVLNRLERRFITGVKIQDSENEVISKVMDYIWNSKDAVVINGKISEVIRQLPIRFTRNKFYNMVNDCLSIYIGGDRSSLNHMMYQLRSSTMIAVPDDMETGFEEVYQMLRTLKEADYTNLTKEEYKNLASLVDNAAEIVKFQVGLFVSLMELVNDLYMMELARKDAVVDMSEEETLEFIVSGILDKFKNEDWTEISDDITEKLVLLEGRQESFYEKYLKYNVEYENAKEPYKDILEKVFILMSGSAFVKFDMEESDIEEQDGEKADRKYVEQTAEKYFEELNQLFQGMKKPVVRAVMSMALSNLPVCFNSAAEVESYIRSSLDSCTDICEKETTMELLLELVESENAYI